MTRDITAGGASIHAGTWSQPIYVARSTDPMVRVVDQENHRSFSVQVPKEAAPDPTSNAHLYIVDPSRRTVLEMAGAHREVDGGFTTKRAFQVSLYGPGMHLADGPHPGVRGMDASGIGGVIRVWEVDAHSIRHALTIELPPARLKHGPVWPSGREDFFGAHDYSGSVPMGTLVAIPPAVDVSHLGLTLDGLVLAHALQNYGAYVGDSTGSSGVALSAETAAERLPEMKDMRMDFARLHGLLRPVLNNTAKTPGGGGKPMQEPAPDLAVAKN